MINFPKLLGTSYHLREKIARQQKCPHFSCNVYWSLYLGAMYRAQCYFDQCTSK